MNTKRLVQVGPTAIVDLDEITGVCVVTDYKSIVKITTKGGNTIVVETAGPASAKVAFDKIMSTLTIEGVLVKQCFPS
jgi:hypothetical protein